MHPLAIDLAEARQADLRETARLDRYCGRGALRRNVADAPNRSGS